MKKLVPDPPHLKLVFTPRVSIHNGMIPADALTYASALLQDVVETIDEHCRACAGAPALPMLSNAAHAAETARVMVDHALTRL